MQQGPAERLSCARADPTADRCSYQASRIISARDLFRRSTRASAIRYSPTEAPVHAGASNFCGLADASG